MRWMVSSTSIIEPRTSSSMKWLISSRSRSPSSVKRHREHARRRVEAHDLGLGVEGDVEALEGQRQLQRQARRRPPAASPGKSSTRRPPRLQSAALRRWPASVDEQRRGDTVVPPLVRPLPFDLTAIDRLTSCNTRAGPPPTGARLHSFVRFSHTVVNKHLVLSPRRSTSSFGVGDRGGIGHWL